MAGTPRCASPDSRPERKPTHLRHATALGGIFAALGLSMALITGDAIAQPRPADTRTAAVRTADAADAAQLRNLLSRRAAVPVDQTQALQQLRDRTRAAGVAAATSPPRMTDMSTTVGISAGSSAQIDRPVDDTRIDKAIATTSTQTGTVDLSSMDPAAGAGERPFPTASSNGSSNGPPAPVATVDIVSGISDDAPADADAPLRAGDLQRILLQPEDEAMLDRRLRADARINPGIDPASQARFQLFTFPDVFSQLDTQSRKVDLKPYILGGWLVYQPSSRKFVGKLHVGVRDLVDRMAMRDLSVPMLFQVLDEDVAAPVSQQIKRTSPPTLPITIAVAQPDEPFFVQVASSFDPEGIQVPMKIKPTLMIETDRKILQGFGVETVGVNVWSYGREKPENITISLSSDPSVHFEKTVLKLDAEGRASTRLRSDWPGTVVLRASGRGFDSVPVEITVQWPWQTLLFSLCGGLLGALLRHLPQKRRGTGRQWWVALAVSVGAGLLVFLLMLLGVDLLPLTLKVQVGYAFVFAASALGAWFGVKLLER